MDNMDTMDKMLAQRRIGAEEQTFQKKHIVSIMTILSIQE